MKACIQSVLRIFTGVYPFTGLDYWTGTLDWTTGLMVYGIIRFYGVTHVTLNVQCSCTCALGAFRVVVAVSSVLLRSFSCCCVGSAALLFSEW